MNVLGITQKPVLFLLIFSYLSSLIWFIYNLRAVLYM